MHQGMEDQGKGFNCVMIRANRLARQDSETLRIVTALFRNPLNTAGNSVDQLSEALSGTTSEKKETPPAVLGGRYPKDPCVLKRLRLWNR